MASVSSTSSLGNTSLRGFGGMVSGIDRDEIIEQMTLGTTTKISNAQKDITKLEWKQEAFRSISDKIIGLSDDYFSFSSPSSLVDPTVFAKNLITVHGSEKSSKYVTASGTSDLVGNVSVTAVKQLATSTVLRSDAMTGTSLKTGLKNLDDIKMETSSLEGSYITFGYYDSAKGWSNEAKFTFNSSYTVRKDDGTTETKKIDYVLPKNASDQDYEDLVNSLNDMLLNSDAKFTDDKKLNQAIKFEYKEGKVQIVEKTTGSMGDYTVNITGSSALSGLGFTKNEGDKSLKLDQFNSQLSSGNAENAVTRTSALNGLTGKEVTFNFNGTQKKIELITAGEKTAMEGKTAQEKLEIMRAGLQTRLDRAFGTGNVIADTSSGTLEFKTADTTSSVSIVSGDDAVLRCMGISYGASSKINMSGTLAQNKDKLGEFSDDDIAAGITINGVTIGGITKDTSISSILSKINSSNAGVKATYVEASGQFMLVSSETGGNRTIDLDPNSKLANKLFGFTPGSENSGIVKGQDAIIEVSYGNGVKMDLNRASNSFNLEGLTVTVSGIFGGEWKKDASGNYLDKDGKVTTDEKARVWNSDSADAVTFTAKADVDKATERVKSFFEAFNELVEEVNGQLTTRPDSDYGPLTDEQKEEMSETSIENWEKKAKQGILFGDSSIRDLSGDIQGIFTKLMNDGASYDDLNKIGITYSSDYKDGGKLVFDEAKFRAAMESEPELVSKIFTGGDGVGTGLTKIMEKTFTPYATRYASDNAATSGGRGSYGRLVEEAGSEKAPTTLFNNFIYKQIKDIQNRITTLRSQLVTQQDRYIKQFSTMENLISQMNSQSSWLSQITG